MAFARSERIIPGAVATLGVSDRVAFLRRTYALLGVALVGWAAITGGMMRFATETSLAWSQWALFSGRWNWLLVIGLFMVVGIVSEKLAMSESSRGLQYLGLGVGIAAQAMLVQPLLWLTISKFGLSGGLDVITQATGITLVIFIGLTLTVFISKKDFSFMRGALTVLSFAALGVVVMSLIFGFSLGAVFSGAMVALMAGYILYQTSIIMNDFPPSAFVAAALMLFSTVATLFWYVLRLLSSLRGN